MDARTHGPTDPRTHGPMDPRTHGPTDKPSNRDADASKNQMLVVMLAVEKDFLVLFMGSLDIYALTDKQIWDIGIALSISSTRFTSIIETCLSVQSMQHGIIV